MWHPCPLDTQNTFIRLLSDYYVLLFLKISAIIKLGPHHT